MSLSCKKCNSNQYVKNGFVRSKQRYKCLECGCNYVEGDQRFSHETAIKRAFAVILYSLGKSSYGFIAKLFGVTPPAVQKWLKQEADLMQEPEIDGEIREIEFDEMWHFLQKKHKNYGSSKPWIVLHSELLHGLQVVVMLQHSEIYTIKSNT
jgi:transposase